MKMNEIFTESAYNDGVRDGRRGRVDPRASSKYGPQAGDYQAGYSAGEKQAKADGEKKQADYDKKRAPFQAMTDDELVQRRDQVLARRREIEQDVKRRSMPGGATANSPAEIKAEYKQLASEFQMIALELQSRDLPVNETTSAGAVAAVAMPMGGMQKRPNPSVFPNKTRKSKKDKK